MLDDNELRKYIKVKLAILQDDFNKLGVDSFYDSGLEDGIPVGEDTDEIYDNAFGCGEQEGEYKTLLMLKILME